MLSALISDIMTTAIYFLMFVKGHVLDALSILLAEELIQRYI